jgi:hypothetical protein
MTDCSNLQTKTSHDLMRDAVDRYGLTAREIVAKMVGGCCSCCPAIVRPVAERLTGDFLAGESCPLIVACAITELVTDTMKATRQ